MATITITANTNDTELESTDDLTQSGSSSSGASLRVGLVGNGSSVTNIYESWLEFNTGDNLSVAQKALVTSSAIEGYVTANGNPGGIYVTIYCVDDDATAGYRPTNSMLPLAVSGQSDGAPFNQYRVLAYFSNTTTHLITGSGNKSRYLLYPFWTSTPNGSRYLTFNSADAVSNKPRLVITWDSAPKFSVAPSLSYPAGATAIGPSATPATFSFTATDPTYTGAGQITVKVKKGATVLATSTATSASPTTINVPYTAGGLTSGDNSVVVELSNAGGDVTTSSSMVLKLDALTGPTVTNVAVDRTRVSSNNQYAIQFKANDDLSVAANQMAWQIRTGAAGTGSLVGSGVFTASGSVTQSAFVTDAGLSVGANVTRYLRVFDGALNVTEASVLVYKNVAPSFSVAPSSSHGAGFTRIGPSNLSASISFTPNDSDNGATDGVTYRLRRSSDGYVYSTGTCTNGSPKVITVAWNATNMATGTNTLNVQLDDGVDLAASSGFTVVVDPTAPTATTGISISPSTITSSPASYSVTFTPQDADSTSASEMRYEVRTSSGGAGTLLASGTCTSNSQVTGVSVTGDSVVNGTNQRYVRTRDGANAWTDTSFTFTATLAAVADLTVQTVTATAAGLSAALRAPTYLVLQVSGATSSPTASVSSTAYLGLQTLTASMAHSVSVMAPSLMHPQSVEAGAGVVGQVSAPARLSVAIVDAATSLVAMMSTVPLLSLATVSASASTPANPLAATPGPAFLTLSVPATSVPLASISATPLVAFLALQTAGAATTVSNSLGGTPHIGDLHPDSVVSAAIITHGTFGLLAETPNIGPLLFPHALTPSSSASIAILGVAGILWPSQVAAAAAASSTLQAAMARSELVLLEALGQVSAPASMSVELVGRPTALADIQVEAYGRIAREVQLLGETEKAVAGEETTPTEWRTTTSGLEAVELEMAASLTQSAQPRAEMLQQAGPPTDVPWEARGWVVTSEPMIAETLAGIQSQASASGLEILYVSTFADAVLPTESLLDPGATVIIATEGQALLGVQAEAGLEGLQPVAESATQAGEVLKGIPTEGMVQVEAKGYALSIGPNVAYTLVVRMGPVSYSLAVHRVQSKNKLLRVSGTSTV